jgi:hypothetical protein
VRGNISIFSQLPFDKGGQGGFPKNKNPPLANHHAAIIFNPRNMPNPALLALPFISISLTYFR